MMSLEFELPLFSLIFLVMLIIIYSCKPKIKLIENKYYDYLLLFSLLEIILSFIAHFLSSIYGFDIIQNNFYVLYDYINKFVSTCFAMVTASLFCYSLSISYKKIKDNDKIMKASLFLLD